MLLSTFTGNHVHARNHVDSRCWRSIVAKATFSKAEKEIFRKQGKIGPLNVIVGESISRIALRRLLSRSVCRGTGANRPVSFFFSSTDTGQLALLRYFLGSHSR